MCLLKELPLVVIWGKLALKLKGRYNYYGVSGNFESINAYHQHALLTAFKWMNRRSQKKSWNSEVLPKVHPATSTSTAEAYLCNLQYVVNIDYCRAVCGKSARTVHLGVSITKLEIYYD